MRRCKFSVWVRKIPWRRKWHPSSVFSPGKSHGQRSLIGYSPWGHKELDTTKWLHFLSFFLNVAQPVKKPAMRETCVLFLGWKDALEKGKVPTPVFWPREFQGLYSPWGHKESDMTELLSLHFTSNTKIPFQKLLSNKPGPFYLFQRKLSSKFR